MFFIQNISRLYFDFSLDILMSLYAYLGFQESFYLLFFLLFNLMYVWIL